MDIVYELEGVEFEWDAEKYASNLNKHGVKFEDTAEIFFDPFYQQAMLQSRKKNAIL